ncbi:hypothetical protein CEXT_159941 [Caerostris extrusa]|uniref:Uncharacterized protein n=1 Tax=Caerostris extrusa TaxID=172846 RepID=A0AAV4TTB9_CAEEX|nr:hypothetical protein CEXT_159941 [Caerostris extrusa]
METRSTSTRIRQVEQKSENHRGPSPKSTEEAFRVGPCAPTFQPSPFPCGGGKDAFTEDNNFLKAQLNVELCGETSLPSLTNPEIIPQDLEVFHPPTPINSRPYPIRKSVALR